MSTIYRGQFSTLWLTLQSNEQLGILDSDYLEDYNGNAGQVTLHHVDSATDYPVLMIGQPAETPLIPHDVFHGQVALAGLPNGQYQVRGRCCDIAGNYSILNSVAAPVGDEQVLGMGLEIRPGQGRRITADHQGLVRPGLLARTITRQRPTVPALARTALNPVLRSAARRQP